jgi:hypothetical protein
MGLFDDLFGGGAEKRAAEKNRQLYDGYSTQGNQYLDQGYQTGVTNLNNGLGSFTPLSDLGKKYGAGTDLYLDALGTNGADGSSRAQAAFTNAPGYQSGRCRS